jgi:signal transduction histidine kinase
MTEKIKQLEERIKLLPNNEEKIDLVNELSWKLRYNDTKRALELSTECTNFAREISYQKGLAYGLRNQAFFNFLLSDNQNALSQSLEALNLFQQIADRYGEASALNNIGNIYNRLGEYGNALDYHFKSLKIQEELGHKKGQASSLNNLGNVYYNLGDYLNALDCYSKSLEIQEIEEDKYGQAVSLNNIGNIYEKLGDYSNALDYQLKSLKIKDEVGDKRGEAASLSNVGNIYYSLGNYTNALEYNFKSLKIFQDLEYKHGEVTCLNSIGNIYEKLADYSKALDYHFKSLKIQEEIEDKAGQGQSLGDIGLVYMRLGDYQNALDFYLKSLQILKEIGNKDGEAKTLLNLGTLYIKEKVGEKALQYLREALVIAKETKSKQLIYETHKALSENYELIGDFSKALEHYKLFHEIEEEVFNEEADKKTKKLIIHFEAEKSEKEAEIYRLKNVELVKLNQALQEANELKMELLAIAAHDLKNPLNSIMSSAKLISSEATGQTFISELSESIYQLSRKMLHLIVELLETSAIESGKLEFNYKQVDVNKLAEIVMLSNQPYAIAKKQKLTLSKETGNNYTVKADEQRLREVMDNLVSNAIKYSPLEKSVWITVKNVEQNVRFEVKDEGPGLTEEDKKKIFGKFQKLSARPTGGETSTGLGLSIAKQLIEIQGGRIWVESEKGKGSTFVIELPKG